MTLISDGDTGERLFRNAAPAAVPAKTVVDPSAPRARGEASARATNEAASCATDKTRSAFVCPGFCQCRWIQGGVRKWRVAEDSGRGGREMPGGTTYRRRWADRRYATGFGSSHAIRRSGRPRRRRPTGKSRHVGDKIRNHANSAQCSVGKYSQQLWAVAGAKSVAIRTFHGAVLGALAHSLRQAGIGFYGGMPTHLIQTYVGELELIQTQMTQKPVLRADVYARSLRTS
jgi:hypothetical protein